MAPTLPRLSVLDALRGIAALGVCWHHFINGNPKFLPEGPLKSSGAYGWLGVEIFFVISGFIIPYALQRNQYRVADYGTFLLKRIIRLDPPYLVAILVVIVLGYVSTAIPGFQGPPFTVSVAQVALHLGYVNVFFGQPWLNPVFWTLGIELQYYLLVGLLFPVIAHRSAVVRMFTFVCLAGLGFAIPAGHLVFSWLLLFMLGMTAFQFHIEVLRGIEFILLVLLIAAGAWLVNGFEIALVGMTTALIIGFVRVQLHGLFIFFGNISYSLYLIHVPVGGRVINLSARFVDSIPGKLGVLAIAMASSVAAAWLMYRFIERPAQHWSSRIRFRRQLERSPSNVQSLAAKSVN